MYMISRLAALAAAIVVASVAETANTNTPGAFQLLTNLRREGPVQPNATSLFLSWALPGGHGHQTRFSIELADAVTGEVALRTNGSSSEPSTRLLLRSTVLKENYAYKWRILAVMSDGTSFAWSDWASVTTGWVSGPDPKVAEPMWLQGADGFVFFRKEVDMSFRGDVVLALATITANPQTTMDGLQNAKLLASYKLFLDGAFVGVGPGRVSTCGPVCPIQGASTECSCEPHHLYDVFNVTALVTQSPARGPGARLGDPDTLTVALQTYMSSNYGEQGGVPPKVLLQLDLVLRNGTRVTIGSGPGFKAYNATDYFNPTCCASAYKRDQYQPHDNFDASAEPVGWKTGGYDDSSWQTAAPAPGWWAPLRPRPSSQLVVTHGIQPQDVREYPAPSLQATGTESPPGSSLDVFVDFGFEFMGGLDVSVDAPPEAEGLVLDVSMAEVLLPGTAWPRDLKVPMNTGNDYHEKWTLRAGRQTFTQHEYSEFRYARIRYLQPQQCTASALGDYTTPLKLGCPADQSVDSVTFASFGTPTGSCDVGFKSDPTCDSKNSVRVLTDACVGKSSCTIVPSTTTFGGDPCDGTVKRLAASVHCSASDQEAKAIHRESGEPIPPPLSAFNITAWRVRYDADYSGTDLQVEAGNSTLADAVYRVHKLSRDTQITTSIDMFTDSNTRQRDVMCAEAVNINSRMGWASSIEYMLQRQSIEYTIQQRGWGGPGAAEWPMIMVLTIYQDYYKTGLLDLAEKHYGTLKNWTGLPLVNSTSGLWSCPPCGGLSRVEHCTANLTLFSCNGPEVDWPSNLRDGFVYRPENTVVNAFSHRALLSFEGLARALNRTADADMAAAAASRMRKAAQSLLLPDMSSIGPVHLSEVAGFLDGVGTEHQAWHSTVFGLLHGLSDDLSAQQREALLGMVRQRMEEIDGIVGGVYLGPWAITLLFQNVTDHGHSAVRFMAAAGPHSWLHELSLNATAGMEAWDPSEKPNLTYSHPWGAPLIWVIAEYLLGVQATSPAYATFDVRPQLGALTSASSAVPSIRGPIEVSANQTLALAPGALAPEGMTIRVRVPGSSRARVLAAVTGPTAAIEVDGVKLTGIERVFEEPHGNYAVVELAPGDHVVQVGTHVGIE